ncbi:MFS transporter [Streptomyces sp. NPDC056296]|uniref:MFS transporter n=1 Tax=Streptomyces sp. NPDC056296 TaxID=3345775 RepID=UPI0035E15D07
MASRSGGERRSRSPWWVVVGCGTTQAVGPQPLIMGTFSLFMVPIATAGAGADWSRASVTAAFTFSSVGTAAGLLGVGWLLDRFALRWILVPAWLLYCLSIATLAVMPHQLPLFYLPYFLIGLFGSVSWIPLSKAVVSWFDNKRGTALGLTAALMGVGSTLLPALAGFLISSAGWRGAYGWLALLALGVGLTMILTLIRVSAERSVRGRLVTEAPERDQAVDLTLPGLTLRQALSGRHFWQIAFVLCLASIPVVGIQANIVPMMTDRGMDSARAAVLLSVFGLASILGRAAGVLLDWLHGPVVGAVALLCPVAGVGLLFLDSFAAAALGVGLVGLCSGMEIDMMAFFVSRYLGTRRFGAILGVLQPAILLSIACGPLLVGIGYDLLGSYEAVMPFLATVLVVCAATILFLGPYRYPAIADFDRTAARDEMTAADRLARVAGQEGDGPSDGKGRGAAAAEVEKPEHDRPEEPVTRGRRA